MKTFTVGEALRFGWLKTKEHSGLLFKVMLALFALEVAQQILNRTIEGTLIGALASIALAVLSIVMSAGLCVITLRLARGKAAHFGDLFPWSRMVWLFFLASLLMWLAIVGGLILLIIPGIVILIRLSFVRYAVVDGMGPVEGLKRSWAMTRGHWWHIFGFVLAMLGLNIVGAMLLLVGLLVTVPVSMMAWAHVYLKLKEA